ncbi:MAG: metallophosphoesterase [Chitinispirillales bacterium]|jgi:predicted MPP superfamily phosphohydrolase|nr:metallophosphoesterase [Chitinispirillales bacterium]
MKPAAVTTFFLIVLTLYAGANLYIWKRLSQCVCALCPKTNAVIFAIIYAVFAALLIVPNFAAFATLPAAIKDALRWSSGCWVGFFLYALMLFVAADAVTVTGRLSKLIPRPVPQSIRLYAGLAVITLTAALMVYGIINASKIKVTSYTVRLNSNKALPGGMKIVLASDLHLGAAGSEKRLPKIVDAINSQKPDLICLAGDIFNSSYNAVSDPEKASELLKSLSATHGVYACPGNHDAGKSAVEMVDFLERSGVKLLNDEFDIVNGQIVVLGRLDPRPIGGFGGLRRAGIAELIVRTGNETSVTLVNKKSAPGQSRLLTVNGNMPIIVIDHNPKSIHEYGNEVDLVLSGHTHKGQLFPANLITKAVYTADYGHYQKEPNAPNLIVTSGAGTWGPPMRVGTNCEIVGISLF